MPRDILSRLSLLYLNTYLKMKWHLNLWKYTRHSRALVWGKYLYILIISFLIYGCKENNSKISNQNELELSDIYSKIDSVKGGIFYILSDSAINIIEKSININSNTYCMINTLPNYYFEFGFLESKQKSEFDLKNQTNRFLLLSNKLVPIVFPSDIVFTNGILEEAHEIVMPPTVVVGIKREIVRSRW